jgi:5,10-methylenetetrahydromethanopterin reductase
MRIGLTMGAARPADDYNSLIRQVVEAEKDGFETLSFNSGLAGEPLVTIAVAGRETSRIELQTGIAVTYTRHPLLMAQAALTANAACNGRLVLGVGPSHRPTIERLGLSYEHAGVHAREYVTIVKALLTESKVEFHGDFYDVETALQLSWGRPCPVLVAALAPHMLRTAGEVADGTVTWMVGPKTLREHIRPRIDAAAAAAGRPEPRVSAGLPVAVCDDVAAGRERAARAFQTYGGLPNYRRVLDIEGGEVDDLAIVGTEGEVERRIREIADAGADDFHASIFVASDNAEASVQRTRELLKGLVGKV